MKKNSLSCTCAKRKNRDIATTGEYGFEFQKALATKNVLKDAMLLGYNNKEIKESLEKAYAPLEFPSEETKKIIITDMCDCICRYLISECRKPIFAEPRLCNIFDTEMTVVPDLVFIDTDTNTIEVVKIKTGKNYMTQKEISENLELYALFCYGKNYVLDKTKMRIKASYYFLRKKTDDPKNNSFEWDFFEEKGKNVVSIEGIFSRDIINNVKFSDLDEKYQPLFEAFLIGKIDEDVTEDECKNCDFCNICNFKHSPQYVTKEHTVRSIKDLMLTPNQEAAIAFSKGLARINAGAGAGKTLIVALRVVTLISNGVKPEEICLLTFTNSGADEMKERVQLYNLDFGTGADTSKIISSTFNGFANEIVQKEYERLGFTLPPTIIDEVERYSIIADIIKNNYIPGVDYRNFLANTVNLRGALAITAKAFNIIKTYSLTLGDEDILIQKLDSDYRFITNSAGISKLLEVFNEYDSVLKRENLIEFADQELLMFEILKQDPFYFEKMGIKHIVVDEFQDSNQKQIDLIKNLRECSSFESLMVVGDDSQSIYSFRDTSPEYIVNFFDIMEEKGEDFFLLENHRSTPPIIDLANKINELNIEKVDKQLIATKKSGIPPIVQGFYTKEDEEEYIVEKIKEKIQNGVRPENIAYLASDKFELLKMGDALTRANIPWVMLNPEPVLENAKVVAAIALAKAINSPENTEAILTYLNVLFNNELLHKTDDEINNLILAIKDQLKEINVCSDEEKKIAFHNMVEPLDDDDELFQNFLEKIKRKKTFAAELKYLLDFELYGAGVTYKRCKDYPGVVLTTAHSSKGLEWDVCFVSISKFHTKSLGTGNSFGSKQKAIEEKRRLLFVSITRAREELYVTGQYVAFGPKTDRVYNKFLKELYDALNKEYDPIDPMEEERTRLKKEEAAQKAKKRKEKEREKILNAVS